MRLYFFEDYKEIYPELKGTELTDQLVLQSLREYGIEISNIKRTEKGKPYIDGNVHFSVSHSGDYFVCLVAEQNIGVDIQLEKKANIDKLICRYFTEAEIEYVKKHGSDGFFEIWARKEAYCKLTGNGLQDILLKTPVLDRSDIEFIDFKLDNNIFCSCCMKK